MTRSRFLFRLFATGVACLVFGAAQADDQSVMETKLRSAHDFDGALPVQPIGDWLRAHLPSYQISWGEHITDCGEGTGSAVDKERDMPLCAEIEVKDGPKAKGYLALLVGTQKRGLLEDGIGLYFGYLEHRGTKFEFKRLSDVLKISD